MIDTVQPTRRSLIAGGLAATVLPGLARAATDRVLIRNALIETGYARDGDAVIGTQTAKVDLLIENGRFARIAPAGTLPPEPRSHDAGGLLLLPSMRDMHIHLDKTFYGGPWVPARKYVHTIASQIELEKTLEPQQLPMLEERAGKLVDLLHSKGTTFARSQCNVDPVIGTKHVELLKHALDQRRDTFGYEIVAFPQHGFVSAHLEPMMRQAMQMGATHVGGIDPTEIDGGMERSIDAMLQIALDYKKGVDIHLHERGPSGVAAIRRIADAIDKEPSLKGHVTISHCFPMINLPDAEVLELGQRMASLGMTITSTLPFNYRVMPIPTLLKAGVPVYAGTDTVMDHWSLLGSADIMEKARLACQLYGWNDEVAIGQALRISTGGITPLDAGGKQVWPKPGDAADMILAPASCSAEAVARQPERKAVFYRGNLAFGSLPAKA